jgi:hypothetical protein
MRGDEVKLLGIVVPIVVVCMGISGTLDAALASQMASNPYRGPKEIVAEMVRIYDVVLDGAVLKVDSYRDNVPVFDNFPRRGCSVLHVGVREYLRGTGPDTVRLVFFGAVEAPGEVLVSSVYGVVHGPRVGERAVFWLPWSEWETAEVFSAGQIWTFTSAGYLLVPAPASGDLFAPGPEHSMLAGVPSDSVIAMIRSDARSLASCYRLVRWEHAEKLQPVLPAIEDCSR